jgi:hypothetical protein
MVASAAAMAVCTWGALALLVRAGLAAGLVGKGICLVVPGLVGVAVYAATACLLRCDEAGGLWRRWRRRG